MTVRVKICGITSVEDAHAAISAGADAIGLMCYPPSPRYVTPELARAITLSAAPFVTVIAVVVDEHPEELKSLLEVLPVDLVQFHGDERPEECQAQGRPYIKALRMREGFSIDHEVSRYTDSRGILLDTYDPSLAGGTGMPFAWDRVPATCEKSIIIAGGLNPGNVGEAIAVAHPQGVDVSSGVESDKGLKDSELMRQFVATAKAGR